MTSKMIMTETASTDETAAHASLPGSPNQNNNGNGETKPMEVDLAADENAGGGADAGENGVAAKNSPAAPSPNLLNTPKSSKLNSDCFKTPEVLTPTSSAKKRKRLTPDEKNQREKERQEKRRKLEEEKQKKEEERLEKARQKEVERLKKEEEKRRVEEERKREREKKEEERKKQEEEKKVEREKKEEERKKLEEEKRVEREKKEEERLKKEEERKKKEDERRQKLEEKEKEQKKAEEKKEKQKQFLANFFHKSSAPKVKTIDDIVNPSGTGGTLASTTKSPTDGETTGEPVAAVSEDSPKKDSFLSSTLPFQIKTGMAVAPLCRRKLTDYDISMLDSAIHSADASPVEPHSKVKGETPSSEFQSDFLKRLKQGKGRRDGKTVVTESTAKDAETEIQILDEVVEKPINVAGYIKYRMKLLQFHDNRRPAYWGTWKRNGKKIKARKPLAQEEGLDYEFDSDDEWEDEPEDAEEIGDSDKDEKEDQEDGDEDDEEGWMVPHGYLSDTEREGPACDIESMKSKEKDFYKSLKDKQSIGWPFIETQDLACFAIRICPVFKSADPVKPVRKRSKPMKKELKEQVTPAKPEIQTKPTENIIREQAGPKPERKSIRKPKVPDNSNPYARPPSGFLALDLPSDDEEDMDYEDDASSSSSSSDCSSGDDENEMDVSNSTNKDAPNSDSDDDLFIPIKVPKVKKSPSSS